MKRIPMNNRQANVLYDMLIKKSYDITRDDYKKSVRFVTVTFGIVDKPDEYWKAFIDTGKGVVKTITKYYMNKPTRQYYNEDQWKLNTPKQP